MTQMVPSHLRHLLLSSALSADWYDGAGRRFMTHLATTTQRALDTATPTGTQGFRTYYVYDGNDVAFTLVRPLDQHHLADPAAGPQITQM